MIINNVTLENYRNHSHLEVNFLKGINLILGQNGSGKSSILEAIGFALLNTGQRTGNNNDIIKKGTNSTLIKVDFIGNDGINYIVERKIGRSPSYKLFVNGEKSPRHSGTKVSAEVSGIIGLPSNSSVVFENVITAYQNKITEFFLLKTADRIKAFNEIFDTSIYKEMYDGYLKSNLNKLKNKNSTFEAKLEVLSSGIKNSEELNTTLSELQQTLLKTNEELEKISIEFQHLNTIKTERLEIKRIYELNLINLKNEIKNSEDCDSNLELTKSRLAQSNNSKIIVENNLKSYEEYLQLKIATDTFSKTITEKEKSKSLLIASEKSVLNILNDISNSANETEIKLKLVNEQEELKKSIQESKNKLTAESDLLKNQILALQSQINDSEKKINNLNDFRQNIESLTNKINEDKVRITTHNKNLIDESVLGNELNIFIANNTKLKNELEVRDNLRAQINQIETRISDNSEAFENLKTGLCPFLTEECENIKKGKSPTEFFSNKANSLLDDKVKLENELMKYSSIEKSISDLTKKIGETELGISNNQKLMAEINQLVALSAIKEKELENVWLRLNLYLKESDLFQQNNGRLENLESLTQFIADQNNDLNILKNNNSVYTEKNKIHIGLISTENERLVTCETRINELNLELKILSDGIEEKKKQFDAENIVISELKEKSVGIEELKLELIDKQTNLSNLEESYNLYLTNLKSAGELEKIAKEYSNLLQKKDIITNKILELEKEKEELSLLHSEESINMIQKEIDECDILKNQLVSQQSKQKTNYDYMLKEIEENNDRIKDCAKLEKLNKHVKSKIELLDYLRNNINTMGRLVSSRFLENISIIATTNYQRISGKNEEIIWKSDNENAYQVVLKYSQNEDESRKFEMLSGGEQVSVAISIRAALASTLTKSKFAIFDEPTVNLDVNRKAALSESLGILLQNLDQAIIVTHDDTFREMAQNTIML